MVAREGDGEVSQRLEGSPKVIGYRTCEGCWGGALGIQQEIAPLGKLVYEACVGKPESEGKPRGEHPPGATLSPDGLDIGEEAREECLGRRAIGEGHILEGGEGVDEAIKCFGEEALLLALLGTLALCPSLSRLCLCLCHIPPIAILETAQVGTLAVELAEEELAGALDTSLSHERIRYTYIGVWDYSSTIPAVAARIGELRGEEA